MQRLAGIHLLVSLVKVNVFPHESSVVFYSWCFSLGLHAFWLLLLLSRQTYLETTVEYRKEKLCNLELIYVEASTVVQKKRWGGKLYPPLGINHALL